MKPDNIKSTEVILNRAFSEMVELLDRGQDHDLKIEAVDSETIEQSEFGAVMFSIASSTFRMCLFLHFAEKNILEGNFATPYQFDANKDIAKQYHDYISELGNNLCGAITRMIGDAGFSTGMSTPATLKISKGTLHMRTLNPHAECHLGCSMADNTLIFASLYLFINQGHESDLTLKINEDQTKSVESSGELEFF
ncbi:hypothetical protein TDB9533_02036 [Thalassocella blandensis]|nr:hypothetical protein TDB9533_02036 [Thalassocella blandensis]